MGDKREQEEQPDRSEGGGAMPDEELNPSSGAGYGNNAEEDGATSDG